MYNYKKLTPFKWCVLQNFPFIEADFDALTNYELLCKVVEYLNNTISATNELGSKVQEFNDFFENLDVQEEINNKLDEMAEDGTLFELINRFIQPKINEQNEKINNLNDRVLSIANGSPAGTYLTAEDLESDNPPHDRIYIVIEDGQWYYWDVATNQWNAGGIYQSTGIGENSIEYKNLKNNLKKVIYSNIENLNFENDGMYLPIIREKGNINAQGEEVSSNFNERTNFIELKENAPIEIFMSGHYNLYIRMYDENKTFVRSLNKTNEINDFSITLIKSSDVSFIRLVINPQDTSQYISENCNLEIIQYNKANRDVDLLNLISEIASGSPVNLPFYVEQGSINTSGEPVDSLNLKRSGFIKMPVPCSLDVSLFNYNGVIFREYDENQSFVKSTGITNNTGSIEKIVNFSNPYIRFVINSDDYSLHPTSKDNISIKLIKSENKQLPIKINCLGDSFTASSDSWHSFIKNRIGCEINNYGIASSRIVLDYQKDATTTVYSMLNRYADMDTSADLTVIFGGINDANNIQAGTLQLGDINSPKDRTTLAGGLKLLIEGIQELMPSKLIMGIIPPQFENQPWRVSLMYQIQELERQIYSLYGIPYVDLSRECQEMGYNDYNNVTYRKVNQDNNYHPSTLGYQALSYYIQFGIEKLYTGRTI